MASTDARDLPNHTAAEYAADPSRVAASVGRPIKIPARVEDNGAFGIGTMGVVEIVKIVGRACLIAVRRHLEDPAVIVGAAKSACSI
jgi:hypothetical protein